MADQHSTHTCEVCGNEFTRRLNKDGSTRKTKYNLCSAKCKNRALVLRRNPNSVKRDDVRKTPCTCIGCGKVYINKRRSKTEGAKYCSRECAFKYIKTWRRVEAESTRILQCLVYWPACKVCGTVFLAKQKRQRLCSDGCLKAESEDKKQALAAVPCAVCGWPCGYLFGRGKKFCSAECRKQSDEYKASKRKHKKARAIRKRGITSEAIDPISVFKRDRWVCHLCHKKLKPADRGTTKDEAPELEHIIALSDGGTHTWGNVACSCRKCNSIKGATSRGQTGFSFAVGMGRA